MKKNQRTRGRVRPNSLLIRQEGSDSAEEQWTEESENRALIGAGFEQHSQMKLNDVLPMIDSDLTIGEIAEKMGISVEAVCALELAAIRYYLAEAQPPHLPFP